MTTAQVLRVEWTMADRISKVRRTLDLEQEEFGQKVAGVGSAAVSKWERDRGKPSDPIGTARRIEDLAIASGHPEFTAAWVLGLDSYDEPRTGGTMGMFDKINVERPQRSRGQNRTGAGRNRAGGTRPAERGQRAA